MAELTKQQRGVHNFFWKIFIDSLACVTDNRAVWDAMVLWKNPEHCFFNKHFDSLCRGEYN